MTQTHINYCFPSWVRGLEIFYIANKTLVSGLKFTVVNFAKGRDAIFTVREFYEIRDILEGYGFLDPVDKNNLLSGFEWTKEGAIFLKEIIKFYDPPLSPTDN